MSKKRVRVSKEEADVIGINWLGLDPIEGNKRHWLSTTQLALLKEFRYSLKTNSVGNDSETDPNDYRNVKAIDSEGRNVLMSSWDYDKARNMDIDEYCDKYNLPKEHISSWKAVTHTGTPFYNIVFKTVSAIIEENLTEDFIEACILKHVHPQSPESITRGVVQKWSPDNIDRLVYGDVHIALDPNGDRKIALYGRDWKEKQIAETCDKMVISVLKNQTGPTLIIDELGDLMDGWDAQTVRKGHHLPQCMTNEEAFDCALEFKITMIQKLAPYYDMILCNNVCEDNHAGAFGYVVNKAFKRFIEAQYPEKVTVYNRREFITHYQIGEHLFVLCHGKDSTHLKFGFKPHLDQKQAEKIDQYLKHHELYKLGCRIEFSKGDSHQLLFDMASSDDFEYMNYPALSPSSDWVQVNFKKGRRGFVLQHLDGKGKDKIINPIFLK